MSDETWVKWDYLFVESYDHVVKQVWGRCAADSEWMMDRHVSVVSDALGELGWELVGCASPVSLWLVLVFKHSRG